MYYLGYMFLYHYMHLDIFLMLEYYNQNLQILNHINIIQYMYYKDPKDYNYLGIIL